MPFVLNYDVWNMLIVPVIRLVAACVLGGIIGFERESTNRPAGFRTHILVCVGSALVMVTSEFMLNKLMETDPARLGAQVISGIGFLGAGTIIRHRFNVKGLTTAASLWAVACVGLAIGIGFYEGAIAATLLIYTTLILLKKIEKKVTLKKGKRVIMVRGEDRPGQIGDIGKVFGDYYVSIQNIDILYEEEDEGNVVIKFIVKVPKNLDTASMFKDLSGIKGVKKVSEQ